MARPTLTLDLSGPDGNVFMVIGQARSLLTGQMLEHFNVDIREAIKPGTGKQYEDILRIVNSYVRLVDSSGMYPDYADKPQSQRDGDLKTTKGVVIIETLSGLEFFFETEEEWSWIEQLMGLDDGIKYLYCYVEF